MDADEHPSGDPSLAFVQKYREAYASLGRTLSPQDATPEEEILAAERRLGIRTPLALRDYYRVAGQARDFNSAHDRLLPPKEWAIESKRLVFMEENQAVVLYGAKLKTEQVDPPAFMADSSDVGQWFKVNGKCSVFLLVMLLWESAYGGALPHCGTARVLPGLREKLDRTWPFVGEVNDMRAYHKPGQVVCFLEWKPDWRVFVGAVSKPDLTAVATDLNLDLE